MVVYDRFIPEWIKRSNRQKVYVDDADRFMSLWVAFNGWMKSEYGERLLDRDLINKVVREGELIITFEELKEKSLRFRKHLDSLSCYDVIDMREESNRNRFKQYNGSFESLIRVIYQIRCNLFHGRKSVDENKKDYKLIKLALHVLKPLFEKFLTGYHPCYIRCGNY